MYNKKGLLGLAMMVAALDNPLEYGNNKKEITSSSKTTYSDKQKRKGLKLFDVNGIKLYALNEKSAIKKASKLSKK